MLYNMQFSGEDLVPVANGDAVLVEGPEGIA
jgi:hypothetical protein